MRIIRKGSASADVFEDLRTTLVNAKGKGAPYAQDAEDYLRAVLDDVAANEASTKAEKEALAAVNAERIVQVQKLKDKCAWVHDETFNRIGRAGHDVIYARWYAGYGFRVYTEKTAERLPVSIKINAMRIEKNPHPLLPLDVAAGLVAELRAEADALEAVNDRLDPIAQEIELLEREVTTLGARAQRDLLRLKGHWSSNRGLSTTDIFQIIPGYSTPKKKKATPPVAASSGEQAPSGGSTASTAEEAGPSTGSTASAAGEAGPSAGSTGPASGETPPTA